ncbi:MAG: hypothetical protein RJA04_241 [Bacteroidota bacterium]|jgi:uncharacterized membrane protein
MSIDYFVSRVWRIVSMVAFGITLLFVYRGLPDPAAVHFGETGRGDGFLPKEEIFYLTAGIVTILNVLALLLIKSVDNVSEQVWGKLFGVFADKGEETIKKTLINWLHFLPALINSFLIIVFRVLLLLNDQRTYNEDYTYVPKLGIVLLLVWLLYFPIRLFLSPKFISEES